MKVYYIPNGPKNLSSIFTGVDFKNVARYYIEVQDAIGVPLATGTTNEIGGECCSDKVRVHFLNYLGTIDTMNFTKMLSEHEAKSEVTQQPLADVFNKTAHSINRFNVRSNDTMTLSMNSYLEEDMLWINELIDSPLIYMEWEGIQGQSDAYIPLFILDTKNISMKKEDRFIYEVIIQVKLSHERIIIRN